MTSPDEPPFLSNPVGTEKFCIFCGKQPVSKTKEHVLPRWLIELTGSPTRPLNLGLIGVDSPPKMDFNSFVFPACENCNTQFSKLEMSAKRVVEKLLASKELLPKEANVLLDWLDKVRIGLWLANLVMSKNPLDIRPAYHINWRVRKFDRCVLIYSASNTRSGLIAVAANSPAFQVMPSCFTLQVNHLLFFNVSNMMLLAARLGLPFVSSSRYDTGIEIAAGYRKRKFPLLRTRLEEPALDLYQPILAPTEPIFPDGSPLIAESIYDSPFVRDSCRDLASREGHIFTQSGWAVSKFGTGSIGLDLTRQGPIQYGDKRYRNILLQTFRFQQKLISAIPDSIQYQVMPVSRKPFYRQLAKETKRYNDVVVRAIREHFSS